MRNWVLAVALLVAGLLSSAQAQPYVAYDNIVAPVLQNYGNSLGLDFDVPAGPGIRVLELGVFANAGAADLDGVLTDLGTDAVIYDRNTQLQVTPAVHFNSANPGIANDANFFKALAIPVVLGPGNYSIVGWNTKNFNTDGAANGFSTQDSGGGLINFTGAARHNGAPGLYPVNVDGGPTNRYNSASFIYEAVPEPSSLSLLGLAGLSMLRRRK